MSCRKPPVVQTYGHDQDSGFHMDRCKKRIPTYKKSAQICEDRLARSGPQHTKNQHKYARTNTAKPRKTLFLHRAKTQNANCTKQPTLLAGVLCTIPPLAQFEIRQPRAVRQSRCPLNSKFGLNLFFFCSPCVNLSLFFYILSIF